MTRYLPNEGTFRYRINLIGYMLLIDPYFLSGILGKLLLPIEG